VMLKKVLPDASTPDPNHRSAHYTRQAPFVGSDRQIRGRVLRILTAEGPLPAHRILERLDGLLYDGPPGAARLDHILEHLVREGFARRRGGRLELA